MFRLGDRDLTSSHEARAAQNAQMVLSEGCWDLPRLLDRRVELQKPPLYYWWVAMIGWCRGQIDEWAVRLPATLSAMLCVGFVVLVGWQRGRPWAGILAGWVLASCLHFTWLARVGRIDMPLTLMVTVALGSFFLGREKEGTSWPWFLLGYVAIALGLLLKGPIAGILVLIVSLVQAITDRKKGLVHPSLIWGILLVVGLAGPWFVWADYRTDHQFWKVFFWYHNVERGLGSDVLASHPWWLYGPRLLLDLAPWSMVFPVALWHGWTRRTWKKDREARMGFLWLAAMVAFLSCMRFKRADYLLPAYPGAALFLGCFLERMWQEKALWRPWLKRAFFLVMTAYLIGWAVFLQVQGSLPEEEWTYRRLAQQIRQQTKVPVIFFRVEAHALALHVGHPLDTILEWENLDVWANQPDPVYIVMPPDCADSWRLHLKTGYLDEIWRTKGNKNHEERPLVVMRARGRDNLFPVRSNNSTRN